MLENAYFNRVGFQGIRPILMKVEHPTISIMYINVNTDGPMNIFSLMAGFIQLASSLYYSSMLLLYTFIVSI